MWNALYRDQSLLIAWEGGRVLARDPMVKGETREGGGGGVGRHRQNTKDQKISDKIRCIICQRKTIMWLVVFKSICIVPKLKKEEGGGG